MWRLQKSAVQRRIARISAEAGIDKMAGVGFSTEVFTLRQLQKCPKQHGCFTQRGLVGMFACHKLTGNNHIKITTT
jgi:hypothetical protein